jgi:hypothetical protein
MFSKAYTTGTEHTNWDLGIILTKVAPIGVLLVFLFIGTTFLSTDSLSLGTLRWTIFLRCRLLGFGIYRASCLLS